MILEVTAQQATWNFTSRQNPDGTLRLAGAIWFVAVFFDYPPHDAGFTLIDGKYRRGFDPWKVAWP